jgi:single-stranded DNA-binding protein
MVTFRVGVSNFHKDPQSGDFVSDPSTWYGVAAFRDLNAIYSGAVKGAAVYVEGKPVFNLYTNKNTGEPAMSVTVFADSVALVCRDKKTSENSGVSPAETYEPEYGPFENEGADFSGGYDYDSEAKIPF